MPSKILKVSFDSRTRGIWSYSRSGSVRAPLTFFDKLIRTWTTKVSVDGFHPTPRTRPISPVPNIATFSSTSSPEMTKPFTWNPPLERISCILSLSFKTSSKHDSPVAQSSTYMSFCIFVAAFSSMCLYSSAVCFRAMAAIVAAGLSPNITVSVP